VKKSTGDHQRAIRELSITSDGIGVGESLRDFQGVLGGELRYLGRPGPLMEVEE
jgi:circadian clock protein KaiC